MTCARCGAATRAWLSGRRASWPSAGVTPRIAAVLARYHGRRCSVGWFAGAGLICGGDDPRRRNITNPLVSALDCGAGLPRLDTSRLRARRGRPHRAELLGLATFMHAAGIGLLQAARRPGRRAGAGLARQGRNRLPGSRRAMIPLPGV